MNIEKDEEKEEKKKRCCCCPISSICMFTVNLWRFLQEIERQQVFLRVIVFADPSKFLDLHILNSSLISSSFIFDFCLFGVDSCMQNRKSMTVTFMFQFLAILCYLFVFFCPHSVAICMVLSTKWNLPFSFIGLISHLL